jgi:hypothetical protein
VQLPQDAAEDLAVVAPGLAAPAVGGQQGLHGGECLVGELEHCRLLAGVLPGARRYRAAPSSAAKCGCSTSEASPQTAEVRTIVIGTPQRAIGHQGEFTQGPAVCQTDRRRPLRQGPIGIPSGWPL